MMSATREKVKTIQHEGHPLILTQGEKGSRDVGRELSTFYGRRISSTKRVGPNIDVFCYVRKEQ